MSSSSSCHVFASLLLVLSLACLHSVSGQSSHLTYEHHRHHQQQQRPEEEACKFTIGSQTYDLTGLKEAQSGQEASTTDDRGNIFFYRPCQGVRLCQAKKHVDSSSSSSSCQLDKNGLGGEKANATFRETSMGDGFIVSYDAGLRQPGCKTDIEFMCDPDVELGVLQTKNPSEEPLCSFHLRWATKHACPVVVRDSSSTPQPVEVSVQEKKCCLYGLETVNVTKTVCSHSSCPDHFRHYTLLSSWGSVPDCADCFL